MTPMQIVLPAAEGVNPAVLIDCGGASLSDVLGYCSRSLGWSRVLLPMGERDGGRGLLAKIGDLLAEQVEAASLEMVVEAMPKGATVRRIVIGNGVLATVSQPDGTVLDNAIEAVNDVDKPPLSLAPGFYEIDEDEDWDDIEEIEDEELDDEDEDEEEEDEDEEEEDEDEEEEDEDEDEEEAEEEEEEEEEPDASEQEKTASAG